MGTPSSKFLVALDTGSDLFWLPCECKVCVNTTTGLPYSPSRSSTSKAVPCGHPLCERPDACGAGAAGTADRAPQPAAGVAGATPPDAFSAFLACQAQQNGQVRADHVRIYVQLARGRYAQTMSRVAADANESFCSSNRAAWRRTARWWRCTRR